MKREPITCCYACGKVIKGEAVRTVPPIYMERLGIDFPKSWHPNCYAKNEARLEKKLRPA